MNSVWVITDTGNEIQGLFDTRNNAMASIGFSYHKFHTRIETRPTLQWVNDEQVTVFYWENDGDVVKNDHFRVYEERVHSSTVQL